MIEKNMTSKEIENDLGGEVDLGTFLKTLLENLEKTGITGVLVNLGFNNR